MTSGRYEAVSPESSVQIAGSHLLTSEQQPLGIELKSSSVAIRRRSVVFVVMRVGGWQVA